MKVHSPLFMLATCGLLSTAPHAAAQADTSQWKCMACPYPKGISASVSAGAVAVSESSAKFGDYTGLQDKGSHLDLGGTLQYRNDAGDHAHLAGSNWGLDGRSLTAQGGREGVYGLKLAYDEIPRHFGFDAMSPLRGVGSDALTLPAGFPAAGTSTMPLSSTLQSVALGTQRKRLELLGSVMAIDNLSLRLKFSRDVRDGQQAVYGSFFASASQLLAPVDQVHDQLELSAAWVTRRWQAMLGYQISRFSQGPDALTWNSPFWPVVPGATRGQLAAAPDSLLHQITGSAGLDITPQWHASADFAFGRLTQNAAFLPATLNTSLAATLPALPASSLEGRVETFNTSLKLTATPFDKLRVNLLYARDVRDNQTAVRSFPQVATDLYLQAQPRKNTPFSLTQDRLKLNADYRGIEAVKLSAGVEADQRQRPYTEVVTTRETTVWARAGAQPLQDLSLALKLSHADRQHSTYGTAVWFGAPENPLLRKYNLAGRQRSSAGLRADLALGEKLSLGLNADVAKDDYGASLVGLHSARTVNLGADVSAALAENTRLTVFAQSEGIRSKQGGSQGGGAPDWTAQNKDRFNVIGLSLKHAFIADKFDAGADVTSSRSRSDVSVATAADEPAFPAAKTALDSVKLFASYKLKDQLWLDCSLLHERYSAQDWHLDGVLPATVQNLLSLGQQTPHYRVNVLRLVLRHRF